MTDGPDKPTRKQAAALAYDQHSAAPRLLAKGYGELAEQIIAEARRAGVFVHDSPELVSLLMQVDLDQDIPPQLYTAVAELMVWLADLQADQ